MNIDTVSLDQAVEKLKHDWNQLSDPDRALRIDRIIKSGISIRRLARHLARSESSLRHILFLLHSPAADLAALRKGTLSTNQAVRRVKSRLQLEEQRRQAHAQIDRKRQIAQAARRICDWLIQTQFNGPSCEMMVNEVRHELATRQNNGTLPAPPPKSNLTVEEIIRRSKPPDLTDDSIDIIAWYAQWLIRWTFFAFPDPEIRDNALDIALERQCRR